MTLSFRSGDIRIDAIAVSMAVGLGRKFVLGIGTVPPGTRIRWTTETDPVLDLREAKDKLSAKVTATALGTSNVFIKIGGEEHRLRVTVVPMNDTTGEAVTLDGKIGIEEPEQQ